MNLSALDRLGISPNVVLVQCACTPLNLFIQDKLKKALGSTQDTVFNVKTRKELRDVKFLATVQPFTSSKWLCLIDLDTITPDKEMLTMFSESPAICFYLTCSKYSVYKDIKTKTEGLESLDFYISYLRHPDFGYLFNEFVQKSKNKDILSSELYHYLKDGYSNDVQSVIEFFQYLRDYDKADGVVVDKALITEICGLGGNTLDSFVFTLLKDAPKATERSFRTILRKRFKAGVELSESYDWRTYYNYINKIVYNVIYLKELLISNAIYKRVINLPDGYDEKTLSRYNRYIWRINEIPMSRILRLKASISDIPWQSSTDFMLFIYGYYKAQIISETMLRGKSS